MSYNQTFVDAVRSTGGKNSYRNLVIQAFNTNIDLAVSNLIVSNDTIKNRLMVEVHYYDPWDFCGLETDQSWATAKYLWGTDYAQYVAQQAKNYGMIPFYWDNGFTGNFGSAIFNRSDGSVFDRQALNAYITGASAGTYPF